MPQRQRVGTRGGIIKGKVSVHSPLTGVDVKEAQRKGETPSPGTSKLKTSIETYTPQTQLTLEAEDQSHNLLNVKYSLSLLHMQTNPSQASCSSAVLKKETTSILKPTY